MAEHFIGKVSLRAIIVKDGKVLIDRDRDDADIWELPGGRLHTGENVGEGLIREIREELGMTVRIGRLVYSQPFVHSREAAPSVLLAFEISLDGTDIGPVPDGEEIAEIRWIGPDELSQQALYPDCRNALQVYWDLTR